MNRIRRKIHSELTYPHFLIPSVLGFKKSVKYWEKIAENNVYFKIYTPDSEKKNICFLFSGEIYIYGMTNLKSTSESQMSEAFY